MYVYSEMSGENPKCPCEDLPGVKICQTKCLAGLKKISRTLLITVLISLQLVYSTRESSQHNMPVVCFRLLGHWNDMVYVSLH